jgi:hypothetical protein
MAGLKHRCARPSCQRFGMRALLAAEVQFDGRCRSVATAARCRRLRVALRGTTNLTADEAHNRGARGGAHRSEMDKLLANSATWTARCRRGSIGFPTVCAEADDPRPSRKEYTRIVRDAESVPRRSSSAGAGRVAKPVFTENSGGTTLRARPGTRASSGFRCQSLARTHYGRAPACAGLLRGRPGPSFSGRARPGLPDVPRLQDSVFGFNGVFRLGPLRR